MSALINVSLSLVLLATAPLILTATQSQQDSQPTLKALRSEQARFERIRRQHLPLTHRGSRGECDEHIGRFCFWHEDDGWKPRAEHPRIIEEREKLLASLRSAANSFPSNAWIAGQRIRYLIEAQRHDEALEAVRACDSQSWWCFALEGLVLHDAHEFAMAERAFATAVTAMPEDIRDTWNDIALLLDETARKHYANLTSDERMLFEQRFWWFADPFFLTPGNERKSEHYSRLVYTEILASGTLTRRMRWGRDNHEMLVRYGHTVGWERERSTMSLTSEYRIIGHHQNGGRFFDPPLEYVIEPSTMSPRDWELDPFRARTRYATGYARTFGGFDHQLATFRRGDSAVVVAVARPLPVDDDRFEDLREEANGNTEASSTVHFWFGTNAHSQRQNTSAEPGTPVSITTPLAPMLVSVETVNRTDSVAWRERHWVDVAARLTKTFSVSDPLLLRKSARLPTSLDQAIPLTAPSVHVDAEQGVAIFFEVYGLRSGVDPLDVSLTVSREDNGFVRKAAEFMGVVYRADNRVTMRWSERPAPWTEVTARAVTVQLRDDMKGPYLLTLRVRNADGTEALVTQEIRVTRP